MNIDKNTDDLYGFSAWGEHAQDGSTICASNGPYVARYMKRPSGDLALTYANTGEKHLLAAARRVATAFSNGVIL